MSEANNIWDDDYVERLKRQLKVEQDLVKFLNLEVERLRGDVEAAQTLAGTYEEENERLRAASDNKGKMMVKLAAELDRERAEVERAKGHIALVEDDLEQTRAEVERLRVSEAEAWEKTKAFHLLLQDGKCIYCHESLLNGAGSPCQHQTKLRRATMAHSNAGDAVAEVERMLDLDVWQEVHALRAEVERLDKALTEEALHCDEQIKEAERLRAKYEPYQATGVVGDGTDGD